MEYLIEQGEHGAKGTHMKLYSGGDLVIQGSFDKSCLYDSLAFDQERDINKLIGFSQGFFPKYKKGKWIPAHHRNSVRIGWRPSLDGEFELFLYTYQDGKRNARFITNVEAGQEWKISFLPVVYNNLLVSVKVQRDSGEITEDSLSMGGFFNNWGYMLFPYFGGDSPAPHDMKIRLSIIKN